MEAVLFLALGALAAWVVMGVLVLSLANPA